MGTHLKSLKSNLQFQIDSKNLINPNSRNMSFRTYQLNEFSPKANYDCRVFIAPERNVYDAKTVIFSCTGPLTGKYEDFRQVHEAATRGVQRAIDAGKRNVLLVVQAEFASLMKHPSPSEYSKYLSLEVRERAGYKRDDVNVSVFEVTPAQIEKASKMKRALIVGRDLGESQSNFANQFSDEIRANCAKTPNL